MTATFQHQLQRQLTFLAHSCRSYDAGFVDEALRMAVVLRLLFHDTTKSTSLLRHLKALNTPILSTCMPLSSSRVVYFEGMGMFRFGPTGSAYYAPLGDVPSKRLISAPEWWWQIVSVQGPDLVIRRRDIILGAANKEGAHVDPDLTPEYGALSAPGASGDWVWKEGEEEKRQPITGTHLVYIRQMAYEVMASPAIKTLAMAA